MLRHRPHGHSTHRKSTARLLTATLALNLAALTVPAVAAGWTVNSSAAASAAAAEKLHREPVSWGGSSPSGSTWQPRPLPLPATSDDFPAWRPPSQPAHGFAAAPTTIVIQPSAPPLEPAPPTPAEIRQEKLQQKRLDAKRSAAQAAAHPSDRPLPPSDEINRGSRRSQLAAAAVEQLRIAHWAAQRGATESAKQAATETLRTIAALRDTEVGDNAFTREFNAACIAIRESMDFSGRYGPVDTAAIERLIAVHQTSVLKGVATSQLTSARAVEAYLNFAHSRLVSATQGGPLAAEATMILADLESLAAQTGRGLDSPPEHSALHSAELALMYRRAAVEIEPHNAEAAAELGRTLLKRSIPEAAKEYLLQSVRVAPTRQRVESLLEAAAQSGDFVLVDQCEKQLASSQLRSELPVTMMSPQEFARSGQAFTAAPASASAATVAATPAAATGPPARIATRPASESRPQTNLLPNKRGEQGPILDPTLPRGWSSQPAAPAPPSQSDRRLFW